MNTELLHICREYFRDKSDILLALVYGSTADNTMHEHSDIDIAIAGTIDTDTLFSIKMDIELLCKREVDIIDLSGTEGLILHRIMTKGIRVKSDDTLFVHYLKKALYYMEDFYPLQKEVQNERIRRFVNGS